MRWVLIVLVRGYQYSLGFVLGGQCRFYPSCSNYALDALRSKPAWKAVGMIVWRIARCQPLCKGGWDPVKREPQDEWYRIGPPPDDEDDEPTCC
ncbi:membrane protein insertion efficiency factor YidD [bacterium]|nr:membrane protein insertion efficiency factor YidD [bacterium]